MNCWTGRFKSVLEREVVPELEENERDVDDHPMEQREVLLTGQPNDLGDITSDLRGDALFLLSRRAFHIEMPYFIEELRFNFTGDSLTAVLVGDKTFGAASDFNGDFNFFTNVVNRDEDFRRFSSRLSKTEICLRGVSIIGAWNQLPKLD